MEKSNKTLLIILFAIFCLFAFGIGLYVGSSKGKDSDDIIDKSEPTNSNEELGVSELDDLNLFFDVYENNDKVMMQFIKFNNPSELLVGDAEENTTNTYYLLLCFMSSEYSELIIPEGAGTFLITLSGIKSELKELTNYDYSDDEIANYFSKIYDEERDGYVFVTPGGAHAPGEVTETYKNYNMYYVKLSNGTDVVLQKVDDEYYYYSSTGLNEEYNK